MKGLLLFAFLFFAVPHAARAQTIVLGERLPDLQAEKWLDDRRPDDAPLTCIEFFHTSDRSAGPGLDRLKATADALGGRLRIVVVTREPCEKIVPLLRPYLSGRFGVILDPSGRIFSHFGVNYLPFGILADSRNRAMWMGNTLQLTPEFIEQITE